MKGLGSFDRDRPRPRGFTMVPNALIRAHDVEAEHKLLLIYLLCFNWGASGCRVSQEKIASELDIDPRTVRRYVQALSDRGLIAVDRSKATNRYIINLGAYEDKNVPTSGSDEGKNAPPLEGESASRDGTFSPSIQTRGYEKAAASSCNEAASTGEDEVKVALAAAGINEPALSALARRCSIIEVRNQLAWIQFRPGIRSVPSALIAALSENWAEPDGARKQREACEVRRIQEQRAAAAKGVLEAIGGVRSTVDDLWKLPTAERHMLHDRARRDLGGDVAAEMYGDDEFIKMCKTYALHLLDRRRAS